jgi:hypothetical protein
MGLSISVGLIADLANADADGFDQHSRALDRLSRGLAAEGIDWHEPPAADPASARTCFAGFPHDYLTQLRRILVLVNLGEPVTPAALVSDAQYELDRERIQDELAMLASHLLCHADDAGYYVPVDFPDPLFLPEDAQVAGAGMVGSSQRLLAELAGIAPALGIPLDDRGVAVEPDDHGPATDRPFATERFTWYQLYRACRASIASGRAVVFH